MKTIIIIGIVIVGIVGAVAIFASMPSDTWRDHRVEFVGVASPDELDEQIDCLSKGGVWDYTGCKFNGKSEHYEIEIVGMKDVYRIGEQYDFSHIISGYGYSCGSTSIIYPNQNGDMMKTISDQLCFADMEMKEFVSDSQKDYSTTSVHGVIKVPGTYTVTVTFERPSRDSPTTAIKEFLVPPKNSWYNNQMKDADLQTVIDSCANDSPKERMLNSLKYTNKTHSFLNLGCEWHTIEKFQ